MYRCRAELGYATVLWYPLLGADQQLGVDRALRKAGWSWRLELRVSADDLDGCGMVGVGIELPDAAARLAGEFAETLRGGELTCWNAARPDPASTLNGTAARSACARFAPAAPAG